jgi:adenosylhomocysteine nucleosidase
MENAETEEIGGIKYHKGNINKSKIIAAVCGVGKVNSAVCAQIMIMKYSPQYLINIGVAGGISPGIKIRDIVVADFVVQHDIDTTAFGAPLGLIPKIDMVKIPCSEKLNSLILAAANSPDNINNTNNIKKGIIASGDKFINSHKEIDFIAHNFNASAVDMESGSIGQVCYINNIEFTAIRSISDNADDDSHIVFDKNAEKSAQTVIDLLLKIL